MLQNDIIDSVYTRPMFTNKIAVVIERPDPTIDIAIPKFLAHSFAFISSLVSKSASTHSSRTSLG